MGAVIRSITTVVGGLAVSFAATWVISLVLLPDYISLFIGGYLQVILTKRYADISNTLLEDSAKVAVESIENVYTVATLGIEKRIMKKYDQHLEKPFR